MPPWQLRIQIKVATIPAACWSLLKGSASHAAILQQQKWFIVINCACVARLPYLIHRVHMGHLNYRVDISISMGPVSKQFAHLCTLLWQPRWFPPCISLYGKAAWWDDAPCILTSYPCIVEKCDLHTFARRDRLFVNYGRFLQGTVWGIRQMQAALLQLLQ